ncbi:uncharacterized protein [Spinacia oleracea]|uniref:CCHC-type domain-containing protein n=1 Tax=Spinacia oleracea TaxID=3562 RepID=A0ABM3R5B2_SPIOL|nr:uncharacterized protein LOC130466101 [Spinacia oleracea]
MVIYCKFFSIVVIKMVANITTIISAEILDVELDLTNFLEWKEKLVEVLKVNGIHYVIEQPFPTYDARGMTPERYRSWALHKYLVTEFILKSILESWRGRFITFEPQAHLSSLEDKCAGFRPLCQTGGNGVDELTNSMSDLKLITPRKSCLEIELLEAQRRIYSVKMDKNTSIRSHVDMMSGLFFTIERLGGSIKESVTIALVLNSLHKDYEGFKMHYLFHQKESTFCELVELLMKCEKILKFNQNPSNVRCTKFKKVGKGKKSKVASSSTPGGHLAPSKSKMKRNASLSTSQCFNCNQIGHYKRDCPKRKEEKKDENVASTSGTKEK